MLPAWDTDQWQIPTCKAVSTTAGTSSNTTNPALLNASTGPEATFHTIKVCKTLANPSANITPQPSMNPIPYKTAGFGEGHLHHALPVWGLLLKENSTIDKTAKSIKLPLKLVKIAPTNECSYDTTDCQMDLKGSGNGPSQRTGTNSCNTMPIRPPSCPSKGQSLGTWMQQEASKDRDQPPEHAQSSVPLRCSKKASLPIVSIKEGALKSIRQTTTGTSFLQWYDLWLYLKQKINRFLANVRLLPPSFDN